MNNLQFTNTPGKGWAMPASVSPTIHSLSNYYSPAGAKVLVVIHGSNFQPYSSVKFATFKPTTYFINSQQLEFYVPNTVTAGIYPIEVLNNKLGSGPVLYTLDNSSGYWLLDNGVGTISNTNFGGLNVHGDSTIKGNLSVTEKIFATLETPSDHRYQKDIEPINSSYNVDNLKPIKFLNKKTNNIEIGFSAHELQEQLPCLVSGVKNGVENQTINYIGLIGVLVQEIKDIKKELKETKSELILYKNQLKETLDRL
jgi:hypothetical protein